MLEDIGVGIGVVTGALAMAAAFQAGYRRWKAAHVRKRLAVSVGRLIRQQHRLGGVVIELDRKLAAGTGWAGWSIWPDTISGQLTYLESLLDEAEREEAMVRSLDASGADERLRQDIEEMHQVLVAVARAAIEGTTGAYQASSGDAVPSSPGGREMTPVFGETGVDRFPERRRFTTLMRSCLHRIDPPDGPTQRAEGFEASWPLVRWEADGIDLDDYWAGDVRPADSSAAPRSN